MRGIIYTIRDPCGINPRCTAMVNFLRMRRLDRTGDAKEWTIARLSGYKRVLVERTRDVAVGCSSAETDCGMIAGITCWELFIQNTESRTAADGWRVKRLRWVGGWFGGWCGWPFGRLNAGNIIISSRACWWERKRERDGESKRQVGDCCVSICVLSFSLYRAGVWGLTGYTLFITLCAEYMLYCGVAAITEYNDTPACLLKLQYNFNIDIITCVWNKCMRDSNDIEPAPSPPREREYIMCFVRISLNKSAVD